MSEHWTLFQLQYHLHTCTHTPRSTVEKHRAWWISETGKKAENCSLNFSSLNKKRQLSRTYSSPQFNAEWEIWETAVNYEMRCFSALLNNQSAKPLLYSLFFPPFISLPFPPVVQYLPCETSQKYTNFNLGMREAKNRHCMKVFFFFFILQMGSAQNIFEVCQLLSLTYHKHILQLSYIKRLSFVNNIPA